MPARSFGAWARRIATNLALEHLRRRRAEKPLDQDLPPSAASCTAPDPAVDAEVRATVVAAFGELPAKLRAGTTTLAIIEETPYAEIADALGISINGVK